MLCRLCPAGYTSEAGASECFPCPANTYSTGSDVVMACAMGGCQSTLGICTDCPPDFTSEPGSSRCILANLTMCAVGEFYSDSSGRCRSCGSAGWSAAGHCPDNGHTLNLPIECPLGTEVSSDYTECQVCQHRHTVHNLP